MRISCFKESDWNLQIFVPFFCESLKVSCFCSFELAAYCVVAKESVGKQVSLAFLERVKLDFKKRYGGGKADTAVTKSLSKEFGYVNSM